MQLGSSRTSQTASQLAQKSSQGAGPCAAMMAQNTGHVGEAQVTLASTCSCIQPLLSGAGPGYQLTGDRYVQSQQAEVGQGCNVLFLMKYFDLTPPFFCLFYSAFPHFHPQQTTLKLQRPSLHK